MTSIRIAGMTVESEGEGPPILMLHGLGGTSNSFQPLMANSLVFALYAPICREPDDLQHLRNRSP